MSTELYSTAIPTLADFWESVTRMRWVELAPPGETLTRALSTVERATISVEIRKFDIDFFAEPSILGEALLRLAILDNRGLLRYASGQYLARTLQRTLGRNAHPMSLRYAHEGWELLHALDRADIGAVVTLSAEPSPGTMHHRRMRLRERVGELSGEERGLDEPATGVHTPRTPIRN